MGVLDGNSKVNKCKNIILVHIRENLSMVLIAMQKHSEIPFVGQLRECFFCTFLTSQHRWAVGRGRAEDDKENKV